MNKKLKCQGDIHLIAKGLALNEYATNDMTCYFRIFVRSLAPRFPSNNQSFSDSLHAFVDYYVIYSLPLLKQQMKPSSYENKSH